MSLRSLGVAWSDGLRDTLRFWPLVRSVSWKTSGLVSAKLVGESASMKLRVKKLIFFCVVSSMPSRQQTVS